jgi:small-conductance mechanosensitive channel
MVVQLRRTAAAGVFDRLGPMPIVLALLVAATDDPAGQVEAASGWLQSHSQALITSGIIILVAVALNWVLRLLIHRLVRGITKVRALKTERLGTPEDIKELDPEAAARLHAQAIQLKRAEQRSQTLDALLRYATTIIIATLAVLMVLSELGVNIAPLIAGAGVVGVALGFGAQSLVKDFLSGMFMLMEDQYGVGDVIDVGDAVGVVERVTLRITVLRDVEGTVWYVPNGEILRVGNKSQLWSRIVLDVEVAYDTEIEKASQVIQRVADKEWRLQREGATIIERPELWGIEQFAASAIVIRLAVKTRPGEQWAAGRALRAALKAAFDEAGIVIPFPQQTVWLQGSPGDRPEDGSAGGADGPSSSRSRQPS